MSIDNPTDLETVAMLNFVQSADGILRADSPNGAFLIEVENDVVRFIAYGDSRDDVETFRLVRI